VDKKIKIHIRDEFAEHVNIFLFFQCKRIKKCIKTLFRTWTMQSTKQQAHEARLID
jgi:hypothetical protein